MKSMNSVISLFVLMLSISLPVNAATLVEIQVQDQGLQKMWIDGSNMRVDSSRNREYMLANYSSRKIYIIDPAKKEVLDVSQFVGDADKNAQGLNVGVKHMGSGPVIAGYATQKYSLSVNGRTCRQALVSSKALKDANMESMLDAMARIDFNPMASQFLKECDRADVLFVKRMKKLGMPLATIELNGKLKDEVKRIVKNAALPAGGFKVPAGYRTISLQQKMLEAMGAAGQKMNPEIQKMMQDMMGQQGR